MSCVITQTILRQAGTVHVESHHSELIDGFKGFKDVPGSVICSESVLRQFAVRHVFHYAIIHLICAHLHCALCFVYFVHAVLCYVTCGVSVCVCAVK